MSKFYLSTAIAYTNGRPHLGHALEFVQADMISRFHRLKGDETFFLTGTDEHGTKIYEKAQELGVPTQEFVDQNAAVFMKMKSLYNLSNDEFVRTSSEFHKAGARKLWELMEQRGDIYRGHYEGLYCSGCEAYVSEKDLDENGNCPNHQRAPKLLSEENYFFKLSEYSEQIRDLIESDTLLVRPESRKKEILNLIGEGFPDVSFSRPKELLPWGIEVPSDDSQVMYVWCDALSNYITALGFADDEELFKKFWPADVHLIGKDILRFHAGVWIGMLLSVGLPIPKAIYVHGFITSEGQKMSKSLGNVVDPIDILDKYSLAAMRYYLLAGVPSDDDGDFAEQRFEEIYNAHLANNLGNLVNRVIKMTERYNSGKIPAATDGAECRGVIADVYSKYEKAINEFDLKAACEAAMELAVFGNKYIDEKKPWVMAKEEAHDLHDVLYNLLEILRHLANLLYPIVPGEALKIASNLGLYFEDLDFDPVFGKLEKGSDLHPTEVIFPRIELS